MKRCLWSMLCLVAVVLASNLASSSAKAEEAKTALFVVISAEYGAGEYTVNVTEKVRGQVKGDVLSIDATNANFGEPAPNMAKELKVVVKYSGKKFTFLAKEGDALIIDKEALDAKEAESAKATTCELI